MKAKRKTYLVRIERELRLCAEFEVEATSADEARSKATALAETAYDAWQEDAIIDENVKSVREL